jgi:26S proteasome regulatory subunit N12
MDNLLQTVRDSIADCVEVSYKTMKIEDAVTLMKFDNREEFMEYIQECRDDWIVNEMSEELCFELPSDGAKASDIPSKKLIAQALSYATELERIV